MEITTLTISAAIGVISAAVAIWTMIVLFIKVRNSKNVTITKSTGETITFSKKYNREESKKLLEFMK